MRHIPLKAWAAIMVAAVVSISLVVVLNPQINEANTDEEESRVVFSNVDYVRIFNVARDHSTGRTIWVPSDSSSFSFVFDELDINAEDLAILLELPTVMFADGTPRIVQMNNAWEDQNYNGTTFAFFLNGAWYMRGTAVPSGYAPRVLAWILDNT